MCFYDDGTIEHKYLTLSGIYKLKLETGATLLKDSELKEKLLF
jgi:hypothetical protein